MNNNQCQCDTKLIEYKEIYKSQHSTIYKSIDKTKIIKKIYNDHGGYSGVYINHPNFIKIMGVYSCKLCYNKQLIMQNYGNDLYQLFKKKCRFKIKYIAKQLITALQYLTEKGFAHLDIKPDNIVVCSQTNRLIIIDFGHMTKLKKALYQYHGTTGYFHPFIKQYKVTEKYDIWSLGIVLYEICTFGQNPFIHTKFKNFSDRMADYLYHSLQLNFNIKNVTHVIKYPLVWKFIRRLLKLDPWEIPTHQQLLDDPLFHSKKKLLIRKPFDLKYHQNIPYSL